MMDEISRSRFEDDPDLPESGASLAEELDFSEESEGAAVSADELRAQAERLREAQLKAGAIRLQDSPARRLAQILLVCVALASSVVLVGSHELRRDFILTLGQVWNRLNPASQELAVLKLPPPPAPGVRTVAVAPAVPEIVFSSSGPVPGAAASTPVDAFGAADSRLAAEAPPRTPELEAAYRLLLDRSPTVKRFVEGGLADYEFREWNPARSNPPLYWIDFVGTRRSDGEQLHFVWSINSESGAVMPLSQAARDLESALR